MIILRSRGVLARIDPLHGGEILELVDLATGRQLLGRPPFATLEPLAGPLDEGAWVDRYRGGWQILTPNAGTPCVFAGEQHGFHGRASTDEWDVLATDETEAVLGWSGHGLGVTRRIEVAGDTLAVETSWKATRDFAAFVAVEHITFGCELFEPSGTIRLPGGMAYELSEEAGPTDAPPATPGWPEVLLLDGTVERGDRVSTQEPSGRFMAVANVPSGWYEIVNDNTRQGVRVEWNTEVSPHLWVWREIRVAGGRWREQSEIIGLELASVPHSLGLARAFETDDAIVLPKGEALSSRVRVRPFIDGG